MAIEQKNVVLDNQLVHFVSLTKEKSRGAVLFLHGWRSESSVWLHFFSELESVDYDVFAIDFPGFGKSETPRHPFTLTNYCNIVAEFVEKHKLKKVTIVGHSFGGRVAIKLAVNNPNLVDKLILVDSAGIHHETFDLKSKKIIAQFVKPLFKLPGLSFLRKKIYQSMGAEDYIATPELTETFKNIVNEDLLSVLGKIKQKTLIVWGDKDETTPIRFAHELNQNIQSSKLIILQGVGHFSFVDKPQKFIEALLSFLKTS